MTTGSNQAAMSIPKSFLNDGSSETIRGRWQLDPQRSSVEFRVGLSCGDC